MAVDAAIPANIEAFFDTPTPEAWLDAAGERIPELLLDHANCELKAASTALGFLYRYPERTALSQRMSRLAREELRHFEQVRSIMADMQLPFERLTASRYAGGLRDAVRDDEPHKLLDMLLVGALIEARSCERFARLVPRLPEKIAKFYAGLLASESRHFEHYLNLAQSETGASRTKIDERLAELKAVEAQLITVPDPQFRFHSGPPAGELD
ncbi:MAG: tRNA-(ms[2]io[6]A)-hydroxylase [Gammaproteobacteria bacterium]|jgi:tRNA-(ms[2]io[6]A)-hydroxylase|nr:tRNA-(ms[2]io[6]A)-hydroxylase [Gammaproteobacteria bacterium]MDH3756822.1 tRNA-(ms[2]io[6]A)-hydroxylase [Gammaproteobacteria bacterium]MDH3848135.1 tRNA-(ms[2]io[6]A)-hydroxylase [Gammaproteobacteria bacterium]MDH3863832.1 tRNA-(ms[2]io[6]A)-hydroxylase [Gammaproteobacteria bacterium]MDH3907085.1 tRNA-(ms[2]io[6]A)-hydroxylase [Gammaproteobacteria bacterium]